MVGALPNFPDRTPKLPSSRSCKLHRAEILFENYRGRRLRLWITDDWQGITPVKRRADATAMEIVTLRAVSVSLQLVDRVARPAAHRGIKRR
jgi:hypothetical protein